MAQTLGPERLAGQGLDPEQFESGARAIHALLSEDGVGDQVDLVLTWRAGEGDDPGAYEAWAARGMVRFRRTLEANGSLGYEIVETRGVNPLANQDAGVLRTVDEECAAATASGFDAADSARRFIAPEAQSYPFGYERVSQLFDSPNAPDLAVSPRDWCQSDAVGNHGALHVRQARAPLWIAGAGIRAGDHDLALREVDIAPTCLAALGFPLIDGVDASGRTSSERGVDADVYLARQDGRVVEEILEESPNPAKRLYIFLLDGIHKTELDQRLAEDPEALPALRQLRAGAAVISSGNVVNFPSITWPSHTALATGAWCGHHDVVNPSYYLREKRESVSPQGQELETEGFASSEVESLYEAFHRVRGEGSLTAAVHAPFGRSAKHAPWEGRSACPDKERLKALTADLAADECPRWRDEANEKLALYSRLDARGTAQVIDLFSRETAPPDFVYHELLITDGAGHVYGPHGDGLRDALDEADRRVGRVLDTLAAVDALDDTLFVVTADHGMAPQDVALGANPTWHVIDAGLEAFVAEPMIWLKDLAIRCERAPDGRTGRVFVEENDALPSGQRPALEGAVVVVEAKRGDRSVELARGVTGPGGVFGFPTPSDVSSEDVELTIEAEGFNPRHLQLDGGRIMLDLAAALYGA
jgi:hypothetical protein